MEQETRRNTGDWNTGDRNTGNLNTGDWNTGNWNTGDWNTGDWNTGDWNTGNRNTGYLNTGDGRVDIFGKPTDLRREDLVFPDFFFHETAAVWVPLSGMTDEERRKYSKTCKVVDGYLKKVDPHVGWRAAWDAASDEDRRKCLDIPNWNNEMFKEISGIDVEAEFAKESPVEMTVAEIEEKLGHAVKVVHDTAQQRTGGEA